MARKPSKNQTDAVLITDADTPALPAMTEAANILAAVSAEHSEERDLVNQLLGQAQMADAISKFSRTVRLSKLAYVRENKLYRAIAGKAMPNGSALKGTWEEFCELLGYSKDKVDLDIQNFQAFGEEALESMSRMGIGYRELRQFRKLPEDQKTALIEVAKTGDKDSLLELAEELVANHAKEKEALAERLKDAEEESIATEKLLADKNQAIDKLSKELKSTQRRIKSMPPDEVGEQLRRELSDQAHGAEHMIRQAVREAIDQLRAHALEHSADHGASIAGSLEQVQRAIDDLRSEYGIGRIETHKPAWAAETAEA